MSLQPTVGRPKILDLAGGNGAGVSNSARQEIAWPCHAFRVTLPVRQQGSLNLFEETVLQLLSLRRFEASKLADATCLPVDLIEFILLRLRDNQLLTANDELTEPAKEYLTLKETTPPDYEGRILFRELLGGQFLPVLWKGDLRSESVLDWSPSHIMIELGTAGKPFALNLHVIRRNDVGRRPIAPKVLDVLGVIRQHQRLNRQFSILRGASPADIAVGMGQIRINEHPESYLLRCQLLVPEGSTDFLVADPFGYGCSDVLERAYRELLLTDRKEEDIVLRLRERVLGQQTRSHETVQTPSSAPKIARNYPELRRLYARIQKDLEKSNCVPNSRDEEAQIVGVRQRLVQDLYSAIEWALRYCLDTSRDESQVQLLLSGTSESNAEILKKMAIASGFYCNDLGNLLKISPGRVGSFAYGATDMQSLLAVAIASAYSNSLHPLRQLATVSPDWLQFITIIKRDRDPAAHGQSPGLPQKRLEAHYARTLETIRMLLPNAIPNTGMSGTASPHIPARVEYEARMAARLSLERTLGVQAFKLLGPNITNLLVGVERFSPEPSENKEVEAGVLVSDLCAALQLTLQQIGAEFKGITHKPGQIALEFAEENARKAGFSLNNGKLPRCILTVKHTAIEQALSGLSPTLGASTVTLLLLAPVEWLRQAAQRQPDYLLVIAEAADLRGHGNRSITLLVSKLKSLKQDIYQTIKTTTET